MTLKEKNSLKCVCVCVSECVHISQSNVLRKVHSFSELVNKLRMNESMEHLTKM